MNSKSNSQIGAKKQQFVEAGLVLILGLAPMIALAVIVWGANRCLGISDEGIYLLAARYPSEIQQNVSSVYLYTGLLFWVARFNPVTFRLLGVVLVIGSAFVFWLGFVDFAVQSWPKLKVKDYFRSSSLAFIELGALLLYQWFYLTPNYNTLIAVAIHVSVGTTLWAFARIAQQARADMAANVAFIVAGIFIGLIFFTKMPAGVCLLTLELAIVALWRGIRIDQKLGLAVSLLGGVLAWAIGHFSLIQARGLWWEMLGEGWHLYQSLGSYAPQSKLVAYPRELSRFIWSAVNIFWPSYVVIFAAIAYFRWSDFKQTQKVNLGPLALFAASAIAATLSFRPGLLISERSSVQGSIPFYLLFHFGWILLLLMLWFARRWLLPTADVYSPKAADSRWNFYLILTLLICVPVAGSVGTQNPLYNVPLCQAATWFAAILLLIYSIEDGCLWRYAKFAKLFCVLVIAGFSASQIVQGYVFAPQLIPTNLLRQREPTLVGFPATVLELDRETHDLVQELSAIARANGFRQGGDIIGISFIPGLVYALGGRSPGHPTFLVGTKSYEAYSRIALTYADSSRLRNAFVLLDVDPEKAAPLLRTRHLDFPASYVNLGKTVSRGAEYSLWKPRRAGP